MGCGSVTDSALRCVDRILLIRQGEAFQDQQQRIDFLDDLSVTGRGSTGEGPADEGRAGGLAGGGHTHGGLAAHEDTHGPAAHRDTHCWLAAPGHTAGCLAGAGLPVEGHWAAWGWAPAGRLAQKRHTAGTAGAPAALGRAGRLARAGHTANLLAGAGHTIGWLAARRAAGITHGGLGLGGVGTEDRSGLEAPSPGCLLYPGCGVLAMRHRVSSWWPPAVFPPPPPEGLFLELLVAVTQFRKLPQLEADGDPVALGFLESEPGLDGEGPSGQDWVPS